MIVVGEGSAEGTLEELTAALLKSGMMVCEVGVTAADDVASLVKLEITVSETDDVCKVSAAEVEDPIGWEEILTSEVVRVGSTTGPEVLKGISEVLKSEELSIIEVLRDVT